MKDVPKDNDDSKEEKKTKTPQCRNCKSELKYMAKYCPTCGEQLW